MESLACSFALWPEIEQNIEDLTQNCVICAHLKSNLAEIDTGHWLWRTSSSQSVHIDYFDSVQDKMLLLVIDAHNK